MYWRWIVDIILNDKAEILDSSEEKYDVSVCIVTYDQQQYIKDAVESVLDQKTRCRYEIVIGDDASTDGTVSILKDYWESAKDIFCIIMNKTNLGLSANMFNTIAKAKGKYIIILYGDDYWTDHRKMQIQFDYLEKTGAFAITAPIDFIYDGESRAFKNSTPKFLWGKSISLDSYLNGYDFPMAGTMFRNDIFSKEIEHFKLMKKCSRDIDDSSFCILLLRYGDVFIYPKTMSAYRCFKKDSKAKNFNSVNPIKLRSKKQIILCNNLYRLLDGKINLDMRYGFILASAFRSMLHKEISALDFRSLINEMDRKHRKIWWRCSMLGLARKMGLKMRR